MEVKYPTARWGINNNNWTPVIYKHRRQQSKGNGLANSVTLFVDNLRDEVDRKWLKKTFTQFGIAQDFYPLQKKCKNWYEI